MPALRSEGMSREELPLPLPDSPELEELVTARELRRIYKFLYDRRDDPPTRVEIINHLAELSGDTHSNRDRRHRDLYPYFQIDKTSERRPRYVLRFRRPPASSGPVDRRTRAQVLQPQRCAMCGKTPLEDGVELVVDHKLPREWGGTNDLKNLQPLCEECNGGKKDHFESYGEFVDEIRKAATYDEPQRRIGELLLAFGPEQWIRSDVIEIVASAKEYQEDWQRRMRDLRFIGWDYENKKKREGGRVRSYYRLTRWAQWPSDIIGAIRIEEARRKDERKRSR